VEAFVAALWWYNIVWHWHWNNLADLSPGIVEPHGTEPHKPPPLRLTADIRVLRCFFFV
jgi:hypothetical protein